MLKTFRISSITDDRLIPLFVRDRPVRGDSTTRKSELRERECSQPVNERFHQQAGALLCYSDRGWAGGLVLNVDERDSQPPSLCSHEQIQIPCRGFPGDFPIFIVLLSLSTFSAIKRPVNGICWFDRLCWPRSSPLLLAHLCSPVDEEHSFLSFVDLWVFWMIES